MTRIPEFLKLREARRQKDPLGMTRLDSQQWILGGVPKLLANKHQQG